MPNHNEIYKSEADPYHLLISKQPLLNGEIENIRPLAGLDIVDMGAGTGRLTAALAPQAKSIIALDAAEAMLQVTAKRLNEAGLTNWETRIADHRNLPLEDQSADLIVSGWSICYLTNSNEPEAKSNLQQIMNEIKRVLRPDGTAIILETMGTGYKTPHPPEFLIDYYAQLEEIYGFSYRWIRMDYQFDHSQQAEQLTRFFFGNELADRVAADRLVDLPECAGIWWKHF